MGGFYLQRGLRGYLTLSNILLGLMGVSVAGYGGYLMWKAPSSFSNIVMGNGVFMLLLSVIGCLGTGREKGGCLKAYSWLLGLALVGHITLMCFCFFDEDRVVRWVRRESDMNTSHGVDAVKYVHDHVHVIAWILLGVAGLELTCFLISCCAADKVLMSEAEEYHRFKEPLMSGRGGGAGSSSSGRAGKDDSLSAKQRDRMNAKYGNKFGTSSRYGIGDVEMDNDSML